MGDIIQHSRLPGKQRVSGSILLSDGRHRGNGGNGNAVAGGNVLSGLGGGTDAIATGKRSRQRWQRPFLGQHQQCQRRDLCADQYCDRRPAFDGRCGSDQPRDVRPERGPDRGNRRPWRPRQSCVGWRCCHAPSVRSSFDRIEREFAAACPTRWRDGIRCHADRTARLQPAGRAAAIEIRTTHVSLSCVGHPTGWHPIWHLSRPSKRGSESLSTSVIPELRRMMHETKHRTNAGKANTGRRLT